ncbi:MULTISPECIES: hypothetical protein [Paenibacillus]|uniref:hypothetical protein n=1 Tax=Paenibacillus TaxID=44249 RepID=UPI00096F827B|nr:hypothetical protein [Paenibacillus odorifer]OMD81088.1 hypothetical protein BSK53_18875 [Paenibacillus odorifer]
MQFQSKEITKIVVQGVSTRGFASEKEWNQALKKVRILTYTSNSHTDTLQSGKSIETDYNQVKTVIGRTNIAVTTNYSLTINTKTQKGTETAKASLQMNYNVTADEYRFLTSVGIPSLEQALYVLDAVKENKGKVTAGILKDAGLKVHKGFLWTKIGGSVDGVAMVYALSTKGLSLAEAQEMYRQEVINPNMQQALGLAAMGFTNGMFSLSKKSSTPSTVSKVKEPVKPKQSNTANSNKIEVKAKEGTGNGADNIAQYAKYKELLKTEEAANPVVDSLRQTGQLPSNYITKSVAEQSGYRQGKALNNYVQGGQIGGDVFES